jgi:hypothetical protein
MEEDQKPQINKPRLKSVKSMMATTIQQLDQIANDPEQLLRVKARAVFEKAQLLQQLLKSKEPATPVRNGPTDKTEPKEQKTEPSVPTLTFEERLARRVGQ